MMAGLRLFDAAAEEYDSARPSYPGAVYDLLEGRSGGLAGKTVADGGAGTGIVARQLLARDASVIAFDPGPGVLRQAIVRTPDLRAVIAEAAAVPLRSHVLDLVCFGQSWHWVDQVAGAQEMSRLLKPGGWWAAWWNHPWADGEAWFDQYYGLLETMCPHFSRHQRDVDWCSEAIAAQGSFDPPDRHIVSWERQVTIEDWLTDLRSHSYVIDLGAAERGELITAATSILSWGFPSGTLAVLYQTRVWMARRV
jgi:SAM-dependent methyltransferase